MDRTERLPFLDILRGIAVLWMIETHVLNVGLADVWKQGLLYHLLFMSNGYVAVAFAFSAGAGFWFAAAKRPTGRRLRRLGFIMGVGYWLNMTPFSARALFHADPERLRQIFQCDILHVIALSSAIALAIRAIVRRPERLPPIFGLLALSIFLVTPLVWHASFQASLPVFLAMPLSSIPPAKFPLFPWMGYFFAGIAVTGWLVRSRRQKIFASLLAVVAFMTPFVAFQVKEMNFTTPGMPGPYADWYPSPGHSFFRLSGVVLMFSLLFLLNNTLQIGRWAKAIARFFQLCGQESLQIYVSHLVVVYGTTWNLSLMDLTPSRLTPWQTLFAFVLVSGVSFIAAWAWHAFKRSSPRRAGWALAVLVILGLVFFLVMPEKI